MSNESKDWLYDKIQEVVLEANAADKITNVQGNIVEGLKNGQRVKFKVWFDYDLNMWIYERREL